MSTKVYSIRDAKVGTYNLPMFQRSHGEAERFIQTILTEDPKGLPGFYSVMAKNPEDFDLYWLGDWHEVSGTMTLLDAPQHIVKAVHLKQNV